MDYFDLHCDTLYECYKRGENIVSGDLAVSLESAGNFGRFSQIFAVWIPDNEPHPFALYRRVMDNAKTEFCKSSGKLSCGFNSENRRTALLSVEGGRVLEGDINRLNVLHEDDVIMLTLTWNGENELAHGAASDGGLKPFGRQVIERMNDLGMIADLSHLNRKSFCGALPLCRYPVVSHACFDKINPHRRNLTDEQFRSLVFCGGVMGLCFYPDFLGRGDVFEKIHQNLNHALNLGGENNICIGSDFDGAEMDEKLNSVAKVPNLYRYLSEKGMNNAILQKIFYQNAEKYLDKVLTKAQL